MMRLPGRLWVTAILAYRPNYHSTCTFAYSAQTQCAQDTSLHWFASIWSSVTPARSSALGHCHHCVDKWAVKFRLPRTCCYIIHSLETYNIWSYMVMWHASSYSSSCTKQLYIIMARIRPVHRRNVTQNWGLDSPKGWSWAKGRAA